ncbi:carbonic anhydrase [Phlyctema vagabunda]|uniref:Carbonic anhydrase n=1 Tax=Phlyctema vagabunda TaxID=108571 RepID=A0ABR4PB91_9HELO
MPFDYPAILRAKYSAEPAPRDLIPTTGVPKPQILWVGCSDSIISETETLDVLSEELFVHRNLGNILSNGDLSSESAVEWAVGLLQVKHIVVCGHYNCALIKYSEEDNAEALHGWYKDVTKLHTRFSSSDVSQNSDKSRQFEEIYVLAEVQWLKKQPIVKQAIEERGLQVHALVFDREKNHVVRLVVEGQN